MQHDAASLNNKNNKQKIKNVMLRFLDNITKKNIQTGLYSRNYFFHYLEKQKNGTFIIIKLIGIDIINLSNGIDDSNKLIKEIRNDFDITDKNCKMTRLSRSKLGLYTTDTRIENIINKIILNTNKSSENSRSIKVSVNIAAVIYDNDNFNTSDAKYKVGLSLSNAIRKGSNKYEIYNEKYNPYINIETIENAINNEEIVLYYQPKVDVKSGKIKGVEALIRWFNKDYGYIPPDKLIGFAEKSGYIHILGNWIIKKACKEIKEINDNLEEKIDLSVNVSPFQLDNDSFLKEVESIINETGFERELLKLEITENENIESIERINDILKQIKNSGIKLSIDDFGKGYNSIDYIKNYNVDEIKIDKSLVEYLGNNPIFIKNLINMIHTTDTLVVAEGVEECFEYETLQKMDCDFIQGYYCYKPMELKHLLKIIKDEVV